MAYMAIRLVFSGLIAFVPNDFQDPSILTAYLVRGDDHSPILSIAKDEVVSCSAGPCSIPKENPRQCVCRLEQVEEVRFKPPTLTGVRYFRPEPPGLLPTRARADDLGWLVRMRNVESAATRIGSLEAIRPYIWARISFGWDYAYNCAFDEVVESGQHRVHPMDFLRAAQKSDLTQAVSEEVAFEARIPAGPVKLAIRYLVQGGTSEEIELELRCGDGTCPNIEITNETTEVCDACDVGLHFDHYYDLARNRQGVKRLLPHRNYQSYADSSVLRLQRCRPLPVTAVSNRVICPMALFEP